MLKQTILASRNGPTPFLATYLDAFDRKWQGCAAKEALTVKYLEAFSTCVRLRSNQCSVARRRLPAQTLADLRDAKVTAGKFLREALETTQCYERHWQSVRRQHSKAESALLELPSNGLFVQCGFVQNISLLVAPQEGGACWYARARSQTTAFGAFLVRRGDDGALRRKCVALRSKCVEHTSLAAALFLDRAFREAGAERFDTVCL